MNLESKGWLHKDPSIWNEEDCAAYQYQVVDFYDELDEPYDKEKDEHYCERNPDRYYL